MATKQFGVSLDVQLADRLDNFAKSRGLSLPSFLRELILESLSRREDMSPLTLPPALSNSTKTPKKRKLT